MSIGPLRSIQGDSGNFTEVGNARKIVSGEHCSGRQEVLQQVAWVQQCLDAVYVEDVPDYKDLTPTQFSAGMLGKILAELPLELAGSDTENQLRHFQKLFTYALNTPWSTVLTFNAAFFRALENRKEDWTSWPRIQAWHSRHLDALKLKVPVSTEAGTTKTNGNSDDKKDHKDDKRDVAPHHYMLANHLCIKFQTNHCSESGAHQLPNGSTVHHLCALCLWKGRGAHNDHGNKSCPKKANKPLFQKAAAANK